MTAEVVGFIKAKVTHRICPGCNFMLRQSEINNLQKALDCPRCGKYKTTQFNPIRIVSKHTGY